MNQYTVAFTMISYNDEFILEDCLKSIRSQNYPQDLVSIYLIDGGSSDRTPEIAKEYKAEFISRPDLLKRPDIRGEIALSLPKTDLIIFFSADNRLQETDCLTELVKPFEDPEISGVETWKYGYRSSDPLLCRCLALIGGVDPIAIGLGRADRAPHDKNRWHSYGKITEFENYYKVEFESRIYKIPTIGANGFVIRRSLIEQIGGVKNATHIDFCVKLIQNGYNKFAFVKNKHIIHYIHIPVMKFMKRRLLWANSYSSDKIERIYSVFDIHDWYKLLWIIFSYTTFIFPFFRAVKGFIKKRDVAWFLHVPLAALYSFSYALYYINQILHKIIKIK